jgi:hypothetical protein
MYFKEFLSISKVEIRTTERKFTRICKYHNTRIISRAKDMSRKVAKYFMDTTENTNQKQMRF